MKWLATLLLLFPLLAGAQLKTDFKKAGAPIPDFVIIKPDGKTITNKALKAGKPVLLMIFSPECEHCMQILDTMKRMTANMQKTQLILVTEARNKQLLKDFIEKKELDKHPAFQQIGWDKANLIFYIYTYQMLPQINVYNSDHKLTRTFTGTFSLDSLTQYIE